MEDLSSLPAALMQRRGQWTAIAERAGVNFYTVQRIARGKTRNPGIETLRKIAAALEARAEQATA